MKSRHTTYDLTTILQITNAGVLLLAAYAFHASAGGEFVNINTLWIAVLLGIENSLLLRMERRHTDPFVVVLVTVNIAFYLTRVATLCLAERSGTLAKSGATVLDVNRTLLFILLANLAIAVGLALANTGKANPSGRVPHVQKLPHPAKICTPIALALVIELFATDASLLGRMIGFVTMALFNPYFLVMVLVVYLSLCIRRLRLSYLVISVGLIGAFISHSVLSGSRSSLGQVAMFVCLAMLARNARIRIGFKALVAVTVLVAIAPYLYLVGTYLRGVERADQGGQETLRSVTQAAAGMAESSAMKERMLERAGYLDCATAMVAGSDRYGRVIDKRYVVESVIDNALTPGFDVFDRLKVSLALGYLDKGELAARRRSVTPREEHNSDMLTAYGEAYLLFGYGAVLFLLCGAYAFKTVYLAYGGGASLEMYAYRALVLLYFFNWMNSYGVDWLVSEVITAGLFFAALRVYLAIGSRTTDRVCDWAGSNDGGPHSLVDMAGESKGLGVA